MMKLSMEYKYQKRKIIEIVNYKTTLSWSISILSYKTHIKVQVKYPQILKFLAERLRLSNRPLSGTSFLQNKRQGISKLSPANQRTFKQCFQIAC